ncbi:MAG TPA: CDP-alcohol phosphatidyltransferase family protein [Polyangia bacterium]|jgi:phosphatidylglycerophosphate synthase|nr:CDP-alcohol phosphatidyltransferase family protein [Polyangia bacterium]
MKDVYFAYGIFSLVGVIAVSYLIRTFLRGRARHARTDADGGSVFLNKASMEMGYWLMGPVVDWTAAMGLTPNQVTALSLIPATIASVAGAFGWFGLAAVMATAAAYGDIIDGLLARKLGISSDAGEMLDAVVDRYGEFMFLAGLAVYYRTHWMVEGLVLIAIFGSFMFSYVTAKAEAAGVKAPRGSMRRAERAVYLLVGSGATSVWKVFFGDSASHLLHEFPIILAVTVVGVVSNVSMVQRCAAIIQALRERAATLRRSVESAPPAGGIMPAPKDQPGSL